MADERAPVDSGANTVSGEGQGSLDGTSQHTVANDPCQAACRYESELDTDEGMGGQATSNAQGVPHLVDGGLIAIRGMPDKKFASVVEAVRAAMHAGIRMIESPNFSPVGAGPTECTTAHLHAHIPESW